MHRRARSLSALALLLLAVAVGDRASPAAAAVVEPPVLLGVYVNDNLSGTGLSELSAIDMWIQSSSPGKGVSIVGFFADISPTYSRQWVIDNEFEAAWDNGYVPFVNFMTTGTAGQIATGTFDTDIMDWATRLKTWTNQGRRLFIAPMPEMNGTWTPYGAYPEDFKSAFLRMQRLFANAGVPDSAVSWVFAPNYKSFGRPPIADYYPGNTAVDVVGFSAYNYGYCIDSGSPMTFEQLYLEPLATMRTLAPAKPIFLTQTGILDGSGSDKSAWLQDTFTKLANYPGVRAIIYYHKKKEYETNVKCYPVDYRIYKPELGWGYEGFRTAFAAADFGYWAPGDSQWATTAFVPGPSGVFDDVWPPHPFAGVDPEWYNTYVEALYNAGLTAGYPGQSISLPGLGFTYQTRIYLPANDVIRAEMAVFLLKGIHGSSYTPPTPNSSSPFSDIAGHWAEAWMEQLYDEGLTSGYPDGSYRPENGVTRAEMAVFLLKAKHGPSYVAPPPSGGSFPDVAGHWAESWIEQLKEEGITSGYSDGTYRPEKAVNRAEMAVFLVTTFNLPMP